MASTEKDQREQEQAFAAVKEEFSRLNARYDGMLKDAGISAGDLQKALEEKRSPELDKAFNEARAEAERAGKTRAAQFGGALPEQAKSAGCRRPGAVKI
jgi:ElaB/YqjD/DUF883 family membrane-anchored ribosome-binding protein